MWLIVLLACIAPAGAFAVDRISWLKKNPYVQGIFFGLLVLFVHIAAQFTPNPYDFVGIFDAVIMVAGLFFGVIPACITGIIVIIIYVIGNSSFWLGGLGGFVAEVSYSILSRKYFFNNRRPSLFPSILFFAFGELICTIIFFLIEFNKPDYAIEAAVISILPMLLEVTLTGALTSIVCRSTGNLKTNFLNYKILAAFLLNVACFGIFFNAVWNAQTKSAQRLAQGMQELHRNFTSQIQYMMRRAVYRFIYGVHGVRKYSSADLQKLAAENCIDEINIIDNNGIVVSSSNPGNMKKDRPVRKNFTVVRETSASKFLITEHGFFDNYLDAADEDYRVVMAFPDGNGYLEMKMKIEHVFREYDLLTIPLLKNRSIGKAGFVIIADSKGKIILSSLHHAQLQGKIIYDLGVTPTQMSLPVTVPFTALFDGRWYISMRAEPYTNRHLLILLPLAEIGTDLVVLPCVCILFLYIFVFGIRIMQVHLNKSSMKIKILQREHEERHKQELNLARTIQAAELRFDNPDLEHGKIDSYMKPMEEIGGDFYDHYYLPDGRLISMIADVSGDGIPAAIFMMKAKTAIRELLFSCPTLEDAVTHANKRLCQNNDAMMFVTVWVGALNPDTGWCDYISAGHNPPLLKQQGKLEWLPGTDSTALGVNPKAKFKIKSIRFHRNDHLFLYTDGLTESKNANGEMFTAKRLFDLLSAEHDMYIRPVRTALEKFIENAPQTDDITMLELKYKGNDEELLAARQEADDKQG